jgi:predicted DNA-binding transcriptional regulator AlpA
LEKGMTAPSANLAANLSAESVQPSPTRAVATDPLPIGREKLAESLGIGVATLDRHDAAGHLPESVRFGSRKLWPLDRIRRWIDAGCPGREMFAAADSARRK